MLDWKSRSAQGRQTVNDGFLKDLPLVIDTHTKKLEYLSDRWMEFDDGIVLSEELRG